TDTFLDARGSVCALPPGRATAPLAVQPILRRELLVLRVVITERKSAFNQSHQINFLTNDLIGCGCLALLDEVSPPKFIRSQPDRFGDFIHVPLQSKNALRRAEAAKCPVRWYVCRDSHAPDSHIRTKIRTGCMNGASREHDWR